MADGIPMNVLMTSATAMTTLKQHPDYGERFSAIDSKMKEFNLELAGAAKKIAESGELSIHDIHPSFIEDYMKLIEEALKITQEAFDAKVLLKEEFEAVDFVFSVLIKTTNDAWDDIVTAVKW